MRLTASRLDVAGFPMLETLARSYTLLIPTFNRPDLLGRLLTYLEKQSAGFAVVVLDSSFPDNKAKNADVVSSVTLNIKRIEFDERISPFDKFRAGIEAIETQFVSLCADDDIVVVPALADMVEFLQCHNNYSVAHGFYFNFLGPGGDGNQPAAGDDFGDRKPETRITSLFYHSPSVDDSDPCMRLIQLFRRYEALTYGVYRTEVAKEVHRLVQPMESILARELLAGALSIVAGKVARIKKIYYGRNTRPSAGYENWHPLEWLATEPHGLFREYLAYRALLTDYLATHNGRSLSAEEASRIVDLVHLRYISPFLRPDFLDFALVKNLERLPPSQLISEMWQFWNSRGKHGWRALRNKFFANRVIHTSRNRYCFDREFLRAGPPDEVRVTDEEITAVTQCLDAYSGK